MFRAAFAGNNVAVAYAAMTPYPFVLAASLLAIQPAHALQNEVADQTAEVVQVSESATCRSVTAAGRQRRISAAPLAAADRGDNPRSVALQRAIVRAGQPAHGSGGARESRPASCAGPSCSPRRAVAAATGDRQRSTSQ